MLPEKLLLRYDCNARAAVNENECGLDTTEHM